MTTGLVKAKKRKPRGPDEIPVLASLAARFLRYGVLEKARVLYGVLVALKPKERRYRAALGFACFKTGRAEEALAHLETAFKGRESAMTGWETLLLVRTLKANGMIEESRVLLARFLRDKETR